MSFTGGTPCALRLNALRLSHDAIVSVVVRGATTIGPWCAPVVVSVRISIGRRRVEMVVSGIFVVSALHQRLWEDAISLYSICTRASWGESRRIEL